MSSTLEHTLTLNFNLIPSDSHVYRSDRVACLPLLIRVGSLPLADAKSARAIVGRASLRSWPASPDTTTAVTMATKRKLADLAPGDEDPIDPSDELMFLCLGGGNEVGRSCHIIQYKGKTIMV